MAKDRVCYLNPHGIERIELHRETCQAAISTFIGGGLIIGLVHENAGRPAAIILLPSENGVFALLERQKADYSWEFGSTHAIHGDSLGSAQRGEIVAALKRLSKNRSTLGIKVFWIGARLWQGGEIESAAFAKKSKAASQQTLLPSCFSPACFCP